MTMKEIIGSKKYMQIMLKHIEQCEGFHHQIKDLKVSDVLKRRL
jgi:hypothetical protein